MICNNCSQPINLPEKLCMECANICPVCGVVIDLGSLNIIQKDYPRFTPQSRLKPSQRPLDHYWDWPKNLKIPEQENLNIQENVLNKRRYAEMDGE